MLKSDSNTTRFSRRLEDIFWWLLRLLPFFVCLIYLKSFFKDGNSWYMIVETEDPTRFIRYLAPDWLFNVLGLDPVSFSWFYDILGDGGILQFTDSESFIISYGLWIVLVEIMRFFTNLICFIIRFANKLMDKWGS